MPDDLTRDPGLDSRVSRLSPERRLILEELLAAESAASRPELRPRPPTLTTLPASVAQQQFWLSDQLTGHLGRLNDPFAFRLSGPLDIAILDQSVATVIRRHEALRTVFSLVNGDLFQRILPPGDPVTDVTRTVWIAGPDRLDDARLRSRAREEAGRPFDLGRLPPVRVVTYDLGAEDYLLVVSLHHIASDLQSPGMLAEELSLAYNSLIRGAVPALPDLPVQYADFTLWQRDRLAAGGLTGLLEYWRSRLDGAPTSPLFAQDQPGQDRGADRSRSLDLMIPAHLGAETRRRERELRVSGFMFTLAVFRLLLWRVTGRRDVLVTAPFTDRPDSRVERLIGPFLNLVALRNPIDPDATAADAVRGERESVLDALAHGMVPAGLLAQHMRPHRAAGTPLAQVVFSYDDAPFTAPAFSGLTAQVFDLGESGSQYDLTVRLVEQHDGSIRMRWAYRENVLDERSVAELAEGYTRLLAWVVKDPAAPAGDAPAVAASTRSVSSPGSDTGPGPEPRPRPLTGPAEAHIAKVWSEVLDPGVVEDGHADMFRLGAHSLAVARIAARLTEDFGVAVSMGDLFSRPTVAEQARFLDRLFLAEMNGGAGADDGGYP